MRNRVSRLALLLIVAVAVQVAGSADARAEVNRRMMKVAFFTEKSNQAYLAKDWDTAIKYARNVLELTPYDAGTYYNLACSAALAGRNDEALDALARSIELGWDDPNWMQQDTDLTGLQGAPRWADLVKQADACRAETLVLRAADDLPAKQPASPAPLIVALHGFGGNAREFSAYWIGTMQAHHTVLAAPRGSKIAGQRQMVYAWSAGSPKNLNIAGAEAAVDAAIAAATDKYAIDKQKIVLAGFSQGAAVALKLLARNPDKYAGAITMAASYDTADSASWSQDAKHKPRVVLIVGERDRARDDNIAARDALKQAGYPVQLIEVPVIGHEIPADHEKRLNAALKFVLE